jgi:hypothetical protein
VLPPDRVIPPGGTETSQINLFLHQVTHNGAWRNEAQPSRDASGRHRLGNPPLALDLHYLVSAYGAEDLHAEILLGYAMQLLHEHPVLDRAAIRTALLPSPATGVVLPPALRALAECGLADQYEQIRITPAVMSTEEMSRFWAALQAHYRPTAAYHASVVLIESTLPTRPVLPVLTRSVLAQPDLLPPYPMLQRVEALGGQPMARLGDTIALRGFHLDGTARQIVLENERLGIEEVLTPAGASAPDVMQYVVPTARSADFPVGLYHVSARLVRPGETQTRQTNRLALQLLPWLPGLPANVVRDGAGDASFTVGVVPHVRAGQTVSLLIGPREVAPKTFSPPVNTLDFVVKDAPVGNHLARLRIAGIDSPVIDLAATPPVFLNQRIQIT